MSRIIRPQQPTTLSSRWYTRPYIYTTRSNMTWFFWCVSGAICCREVIMDHQRSRRRCFCCKASAKQPVFTPQTKPFFVVLNEVFSLRDLERSSLRISCRMCLCPHSHAKKEIQVLKGQCQAFFLNTLLAITRN